MSQRNNARPQASFSSCVASFMHTATLFFLVVLCAATAYGRAMSPEFVQMAIILSIGSAVDHAMRMNIVRTLFYIVAAYCAVQHMATL